MGLYKTSLPFTNLNKKNIENLIEMTSKNVILNKIYTNPKDSGSFGGVERLLQCKICAQEKGY